MKQLRAVVTVFVVLTIVTGLVYPLLVTGIAQVLFPSKANGSLIERDGKPIGSELIGQPFARDKDSKYFWSRPSATTPEYNGASSGGANYGPTNPENLGTIETRVKDVSAAHGDKLPVPVDLVTTSASGLDPHISPAAAEYQIERIVRTRKNLSEKQVRELIAKHTEERTLGLLGEPRVNVLQLNLALDGK